MSALWAPVEDRPTAAPAPEVEHRPVLRAVPGALPRLARVPFILVLIAIFGLGMTGLLMLNTTLQNQAFQASTLNRQATELAYTEADLESRLDELAAPQVLAQRATSLGLRANPYPAFLVLPKGKVVGKPRAVTGNEVPTMVLKTPAQLAAERAAAVARRQALAAQKKVDDARRATARAAKDAAAAKAAAAKKQAAKKQARSIAGKPAQSKPAQSKPRKANPAKNQGGRG